MTGVPDSGTADQISGFLQPDLQIPDVKLKNETGPKEIRLFNFENETIEVCVCLVESKPHCPDPFPPQIWVTHPPLGPTEGDRKISQLPS